jgi:hypothetical protein
MGSVLSSAYRDAVRDAVAGLPTPARDAATDSIGGAMAIADRLPAGAGDALRVAAGTAFTDAMGSALAVAALVVAVAAAIAWRRLPDTARAAAAGAPASPAAPPAPAVGTARQTA